MDKLYSRSRRNLAGWFTLSMGSILVVFAAGTFGLGVYERLLAFDAELESKARVMAAGIRYGLHRGEWRIKLDDVPVLGSNTLPLNHGIAYARWYDAQGNLVRFVNQTPSSHQLQSLGFETIQVTTASGSVLWLRQVTLPVRQRNTVIGYLQLAAPLTEVQGQLLRQCFWLALGVPLALGLIALTGWWLGGRAMAPLRQSHQQLQRFTSHASHELRTPLAQILSHAQLLLQAETALQEPWRLERIADITQSLSQLVGDLLFLARHTGRFSPDQLKPLDLRELAQELAWDHEAAAAQRQIALTCEVPATSVSVAASPDLLYQALLNLTDNALKYTPEGGKIALTLTTERGWARLQVINTGSEIPAEALPHVFEQFYRVAAHQATEGFGLGLAIAQHIVEAHGGEIKVSSPVGKGTCFELGLPLVPT